MSLTKKMKESGVRQKKRKELAARIARAGLTLFLERGYEQTTLDDIAAAANISRRTFFSYFKSKEDVLFGYAGSGFADALIPAIMEDTSTDEPLSLARMCFIKLATRFETRESVLADKLLRSTEALRIRKDGLSLQLEQSLTEAFWARWPDVERREELRLTSMIANGLLRIALEKWRSGSGKFSLASCIGETFDSLEKMRCAKAPLLLSPKLTCQ
ncbi:TetR/AcrR family transcriptional regulator [Erwinia typographi]|uniref:TetR/AcrR family transcriptional regulator n=1 Tax=Erwinia typographi TaxID=371042 RepID=UPI000689A710|nr:TetR/AcrR family transcriptional regulator [Erwinia typographi]